MTVGLPALLAAACNVQAVDAPEPTLRSIDLPAGAGSRAPAIVPASDDTAVVTWLAPTEDGHALRFAVLRESSVARSGTVATGSDWFVNWADTPRLFVSPGGDWVAHWLQRTGNAPYAYGIRTAWSRDRGRTWSEPARLHGDRSETEHGFVSYFPEPGRNAVGAVWLDGRHTGDAGGPMTLRTATIAAGRAGDEQRLDRRVCDCCQTDSAVAASGPVVVYRDRGRNEVRDIAIVRRLDGQWSRPRLVHDDGWRIGGCPVNGPAVAADGRFVAVAWFTMASGIPRVHLGLSGDAGGSFGEPLAFSSGTALGRVQLARHAGDVLLTWMDETATGAELRMARIDRRGTVTRRRTLASLAAGRISGMPRIARVGDDGLVVVWTRPGGADGDGARVVAGWLRLQSPDAAG